MTLDVASFAVGLLLGIPTGLLLAFVLGRLDAFTIDGELDRNDDGRS